MMRPMVRNPSVMGRIGPVDQINNFRAGSLRKVVTFLIDLASIAFVPAAAPTFARRTTSTTGYGSGADRIFVVGTNHGQS